MRLRFAWVLVPLIAGCGDSFAVGVPDADTGGAPADSGSDATVDAPADAPETSGPNACGGVTPLADTPGNACGACGKIVCDATKEALLCEDPGKNACGGCGKLTGTAGDPCGSCGRLACRPDGTALECLDPPKNACGGCTKLPGKEGEKCGGGTCGSGTLVCSGPDTFECKGAAGANACGGCGTLAGTPGKSCEPCGQWICSADLTAVTCAAATPPPGTSCGVCGTSKFACTGLALTTCSKLDDTTSVADLDFATTSSVVDLALDHMRELAITYTVRRTGRIQYLKVTIAREAYKCPVSGLTGTTDAGFSDASFVDADPLDDGLTEASIPDAGPPLCSSPDPGCKCTLTAGGCTCAPITDGQLYAYAWKGRPGGTTNVFLGGASIPTSLVGTSPGPQSFVFPTGMLSVNKGDPVFFQILVNGSKYKFNFSGLHPGPATTDTDLVLYSRIDFPSPSTPWSKHSQSSVPQTTVQMAGCF